MIDNRTALTVKRPWSHLFFLPGALAKDVENRSWATSYRGLLAIHAGRAFDDSFFDWIHQKTEAGAFTVAEFQAITAAAAASRDGHDDGRIIGTVELVEIAQTHGSRWWNGTDRAWVLRNPVAKVEPRLIRGDRGLWIVGNRR